MSAQITTVTGLPNSNAWDHEAAFDQRLGFPNQAKFAYEGKTDTKQADVTLLVQKDTTEGVNQPTAFKKTANPANSTLEPGQSTTVTYTMTVTPEANANLAKSTIVDYVDSNIFDISDLDAVRTRIQASYNWQGMKPERFALALGAEGELLITLSPAGVELVNAAGSNKQFELKLPLKTKPVTGSQSLNIVNKAVLKGSDSVPRYWDDIVSSATSYGDEAEVRKSVRDALVARSISTISTVSIRRRSRISAPRGSVPSRPRTT